MDLDIFNQYKELNLKIINSIEEDKEDVILLEKRKEIIKEIVSLNMQKSAIVEIYINMGLKELDAKLENALKEKMNFVKTNIKKVALGRESAKAYGNANRKSNLFSKKV